MTHLPRFLCVVVCYNKEHACRVEPSWACQWPILIGRECLWFPVFLSDSAPLIQLINHDDRVVGDDKIACEKLQPPDADVFHIVSQI